MNTEQPLVYGRDWDYTPVIVPVSDAQFMNLDCKPEEGSEET